MKPSLTWSISKSLSGRSHICQRWKSRAAPRLAHFLSPSHTLSSSFPYLCYKLPSWIHTHLCAYMHAYICIFTDHVYIHVHISTCMFICRYVWIFTNHIYVYSQISISSCTYLMVLYKVLDLDEQTGYFYRLPRIVSFNPSSPVVLSIELLVNTVWLCCFTFL